MLLAQSEAMATKRTDKRATPKRGTRSKTVSRPKAVSRSKAVSPSKTVSRASTRAKQGSGNGSKPEPATSKGTRSKSAGVRGSAKTSSAPRKPATRPLAEYNAKRDFTRTAEPAGKVPKARGRSLHFVIQKHAASHLHYDFRLELDGVMKSWAVPKGPSLDPTVRRLAMEVEDHPISYNTFEGTIPQGEYGGGTVMLWDRGTYEAEDGQGAEALRRGYEKGELRFQMHGKRLKGGFVLARLRRPGRPQWLLIKRRDDHADADRDITAEETTSIVTRRTMEQIASGRRVWHSNR